MNAINSQNDNDEKNKENSSESQERLSAYERLSKDLSSDQRYLKEITLGKRIGFYRIRGELGSGNFSQVKMGIHALTKGKVWPIGENFWFPKFCLVAVDREGLWLTTSRSAAPSDQNLIEKCRV